MSFISQLNWRFAAGKFDGRMVPDEEIAKVLEAIRMAPSSFGLQPFHVTVITNKDLKEKFKGAAYGQEQITSGSHVLVFSARTDIDNVINEYFTLASGGNAETRVGMKSYEDMVTGAMGARKASGAIESWAAKQAYIALGFGLAACAELMIDSCPMEGFDPAKAKEVLGLADNLHPAVLLAVGYRDPSETADPKTRFPASELFDTRA